MSIRFGAFFLISSLCPGGRQGRAPSSAAALAPGALAVPALLHPEMSLSIFPLMFVRGHASRRGTGTPVLPLCPAQPWRCPLALSRGSTERGWGSRAGCRPCPLPGDGWGRSHRCSPAASFSLISLGGSPPTSITPFLASCSRVGPRDCDVGLPVLTSAPKIARWGGQGVQQVEGDYGWGGGRCRKGVSGMPRLASPTGPQPKAAVHAGKRESSK